MCTLAWKSSDSTRIYEDEGLKLHEDERYFQFQDFR
jgi:hypothetical protein